MSQESAVRGTIIRTRNLPSLANPTLNNLPLCVFERGEEMKKKQYFIKERIS